MEYIYSKNSVCTYIENNEVLEVFLLTNFKDEKIIKLLKDKKIKYSYKDKNFFDKIAKNANHQGIIATIEEFKYSQVEDMVKGENPFIVILDGIEDPHNFGAIIRSAEAFGVDGIIIGKHNSCPCNATVCKVATGATSNVKIAMVTNLTQTINALKEKGFWFYAAEAFNSESYDKVKYDGKVGLILGSEGFGISRLVKEQADFNIKIPMKGKVNSLNVSCAAAILISYISLSR